MVQSKKDIIRNDTDLTIEQIEAHLKDGVTINVGELELKVDPYTVEHIRSTWIAMSADPDYDHVRLREAVAAKQEELVAKLKKALKNDKALPRKVMNEIMENAVLLHVSQQS
jgi:hypothetical protein